MKKLIKSSLRFSFFCVPIVSEDSILDFYLCLVSGIQLILFAMVVVFGLWIILFAIYIFVCLFGIWG